MVAVTIHYEHAAPSFTDALYIALALSAEHVRIVVSSPMEPMDMAAIQLLAGAGFDITVETP